MQFENSYVATQGCCPYTCAFATRSKSFAVGFRVSTAVSESVFDNFSDTFVTVVSRVRLLGVMHLRSRFKQENYM